jgi:hypothetical protein
VEGGTLRLRALAAVEQGSIMQRLCGTLTLLVRSDIAAGVIVTLALLMVAAGH